MLARQRNKNITWKNELIAVRLITMLIFLASLYLATFAKPAMVIFSGISIYNFNPEAENSLGQWVDLQPLGTEGQGTTAYPDRKKYSRTQIAIPMGGGVKISLNNNLNIAFSFSARKTYTDYLDDVSTTYPGTPTEFGASNIEMSDPTYTHAKDEQRGNELKDDWYYYSGITISFRLNNDTKGCNYE